MKTFPRPLEPEEERSLVVRLSQGDDRARELLIVHNLRLVAHIVKKYCFSEQETEDYLSIGFIGLMKGIDSYDMRKGIKLGTYASRCIENEILMSLRWSKKLAREVSLADPLKKDKEGKEIPLSEILSSRDEDLCQQMIQEEDMHSLQKAIAACLNEREKCIILYRYGFMGGKELTQREVAKRLGISRSYVSRIEKRALVKLRKEINSQRN